MSYEWGGAGRPSVGMTDGLLYVDDAKKVWQWDAAADMWHQRNQYELREVNTSLVATIFRSVGSDLFYRSQTTFANTWDTTYKLGFIEVVASNSETIYGRLAQATKAQLSAWCAAVIPNDGSAYTDNVRLRVFEVFDPTLNRSHMNGWNKLYGVLRGRYSYMGAKGRSGMPTRAGVLDIADTFLKLDPKFGLAAVLLKHFYVETFTKCPGDRAVWFPSGKKSLYQHPNKAALELPIPNPASLAEWARRKCWQWGSSDWGDAPQGKWIVADGTVNTSPAVIYIDETGALLVAKPKDVAKGWNQIINKIEACIVQNMKITVLGDEYNAWYVKPLGITWLAIDCTLPAADWELLSESAYVGASNVKTKIVPFEVRGPNGWRFNAYDAILLGRNVNVAPKCNSIDSSALPHEVRFYFRHKTTGLRSPCLPDSLIIQRRLNNAPVTLSVKKGAR